MEDELARLSDLLKIDHSEANVERFAKVETEYSYLGGYTYQSEIKTILGGFGFKEDDLYRPIASFPAGKDQDRFLPNCF